MRWFARFITRGDLNLDGLDDLIVTHDWNAIQRIGAVAVLLGRGDGTFAPPVFYETTTRTPYHVTIADFNLDGSPDVAVANSGFRDDINDFESQVSIFPGSGDGRLGTAQHHRVGQSPLFSAAADFNRDGLPDLAVANYGNLIFQNSTVSVLLGVGDGAFLAAPLITGFFGGQTRNAALEDINLDGALDMLVAHGEALTWSAGDGRGGFGPPNSIAVSLFLPFGILVGDLDNDGYRDLVLTSYSYGGRYSTLLRNADGTFQPERIFSAFAGRPLGVTLRDLNADGLLDLVAADDDDTVAVLLGNGDGTFQSPRRTFLGALVEPTGVAVGDYNGDGVMDLAVTNSFSHDLMVLIGTGGGAYQIIGTYPTGRFPTVINVSST